MRMSIGMLAAIVLATGCLDEADDRVEAAVKKLDGSVVRRNDLPGKPIVNVILSMSKVKDDDLKMLADLNRCPPSSFIGPTFPDAGSESRGIKGLTKIDAMKTKITDAGLKALAGMPNLEDLELATNL